MSEHVAMGTRSVVLVRHGEYRMDDGADPRLTRRGRRQAQLSGAALAHEGFDRVVTSPLVRARETCATMLEGWKREAEVSDLLAEGVPTPVASLGVSGPKAAIDRARFDEAFDVFFGPARGDERDLLVCHGNLIRYLVTRALGVSPRTWTRLNSNHCGITRVLVRDARIRVVSYNETGHLAPDCIT